MTRIAGQRLTGTLKFFESVSDVVVFRRTARGVFRIEIVILNGSALLFLAISNFCQAVIDRVIGWHQMFQLVKVLLGRVQFIETKTSNRAIEQRGWIIRMQFQQTSKRRDRLIVIL